MKHYDKWEALFEDMEYRRIGFTEVGGYEVSTVWLGLDHSFGYGPPLIFETMVFEREHSFREEYTSPLGTIPAYSYKRDFDQRRYSTEEQARVGHEQMVAEVREWQAKIVRELEAAIEAEVEEPNGRKG